jgi:hypothetical protein
MCARDRAAGPTPAAFLLVLVSRPMRLSSPFHFRAGADPLRHAVARRRLAGLALACATVVLAQAGMAPAVAAPGATSGASLERRVKAAFLYKFLGYADFPATAFADAASPLTIGVVGADELAAELARIVAGRTVNNRGIVVRTVRESDLPAPLQLLFIGGSDPARVGRLVHLAGGMPLVVTDCENGLQQGSAINFVIVDERVRFDVALEAAERNGIKLSSRLLTVANRVAKGAP